MRIGELRYFLVVIRKIILICDGLVFVYELQQPLTEYTFVSSESLQVVKRVLIPLAILVNECATVVIEFLEKLLDSDVILRIVVENDGLEIQLSEPKDVNYGWRLKKFLNLAFQINPISRNEIFTYFDLCINRLFPKVAIETVPDFRYAWNDCLAHLQEQHCVE